MLNFPTEECIVPNHISAFCSDCDCVRKYNSISGGYGLNIDGSAVFVLCRFDTNHTWTVCLKLVLSEGSLRVQFNKHQRLCYNKDIDQGERFISYKRLIFVRNWTSLSSYE